MLGYLFTFWLACVILRSLLKMPRATQNATSAKEHSQAVLNHARAVKLGVDTESVKLKNKKTMVDVRKTDAEIKLILAKVYQLSKGGNIDESENIIEMLKDKGINPDLIEQNTKDWGSCAQCNFTDASGKDVYCPKCGKPLNKISQG